MVMLSSQPQSSREQNDDWGQWASGGGYQQTDQWYSSQGNGEHGNFQSLAAVNAMGEVGDNANLYYSCWLSLGVSMALVYELSGMLLLQYCSTRRAHDAYEEAAKFPELESFDEYSAGCTPLGRRRKANEIRSDSHNAIEAVLDWSADRMESEVREARDTWYNSLYKLRSRTGIWVACLVANLVALASSMGIWRKILVPAAEAAAEVAGLDSSDYSTCSLVEAEIVKEITDAYGEQSSGGETYQVDVIGFPAEMCQRNEMAAAVGSVGSVLSLFAVLSHSLLRRRAAAIAASDSPHHHSPHHDSSPIQLCCGGNVIPLRAEFFLSVLLAFLIGVNAIFATGVGGPAQSVGNLYYATWIGFLLSVRISVACLEQLYNVHENEGGLDEEDRRNLPSMSFKNMPLNTRKEIITKIVMLSDSYAASEIGMGAAYAPHVATSYALSGEGNKGSLSDYRKWGHLYAPNNGHQPVLSTVGSASLEKDEVFRDDGQAASASYGHWNERPKRLRRWCAVAVFSTICAASAWDSVSYHRQIHIDKFLVLAVLDAGLMAFPGHYNNDCPHFFQKLLSMILDLAFLSTLDVGPRNIIKMCQSQFP